jgi:hypothetical protein
MRHEGFRAYSSEISSLHHEHGGGTFSPLDGIIKHAAFVLAIAMDQRTKMTPFRTRVSLHTPLRKDNHVCEAAVTEDAPDGSSKKKSATNIRTNYSMT